MKQEEDDILTAGGEREEVALRAYFVRHETGAPDVEAELRECRRRIEEKRDPRRRRGARS